MKIATIWREPCSSNKKQPLMGDENVEVIRLEINTEKLRNLLNNGVLCAADFRCLDCRSKQCVWKICLNDCIKLQQK